MTDINPSEIKVDVFRGPIGGHGFRTGEWTVTYGDKQHRIYASAPHAAELDQQAKIVAESAARELSRRNI